MFELVTCMLIVQKRRTRSRTTTPTTDGTTKEVAALRLRSIREDGPEDALVAYSDFLSCLAQVACTGLHTEVKA